MSHYLSHENTLMLILKVGYPGKKSTFKEMSRVFRGGSSSSICVQTVQTTSSMQGVHPAITEWGGLAAVPRMSLFRLSGKRKSGA